MGRKDTRFISKLLEKFVVVAVCAYFRTETVLRETFDFPLNALQLNRAQSKHLYVISAYRKL